MIISDQVFGRAASAPAANAVCHRCNGTGFVIQEKDGIERAARCACRLQPGIDRLSALSIPPRFRHCSFDERKDLADPANDCRGFQDLNESLFRAKGKSRKFIDEYPGDKKGLLFMGKCGVGKTHLAVAILRELALTKGVSGQFCDFHQLLRQIRESYNPVAGTSEMELLEPICSVELLVLDDLGAEKPSPWVQDTLHYVINQRYLRQLATLITTNFLDRPTTAGSSPRMEESLVERIGHRLRSRLHEMCSRVQMDGSDYREGIAGI